MIAHGSWAIVSYPFKKFFNYGEKQAVQIDWTSARVYEKLDGSMMTLYWYSNQWNVASQKLPAADGRLSSLCGTRDENPETLADLFWQVWERLGMCLPAESHRHICFMFELTSSVNRIVVAHNTTKLSCIGARDLTTSKELQLEPFADEYSWTVPPQLPYSSLEECVAAAKQLNPVECEGFVVVDAQWNRVKIKSPQYVALHHLTDNKTKGVKTTKQSADANKFQTRQLIEIVRSNECDEFLAYYPELEDSFSLIKAKYNHLCRLLSSGQERRNPALASAVQRISVAGCPPAAVLREFPVKVRCRNLHQSLTLVCRCSNRY